MILRADSISRSFEGRRVLSAARLSVSRGEVVGLLGRMGQGKSTLMKICAGVQDADSGWVEFDGQQYERPRLSKLAVCGVFYLAETDNLVSALTISQHFDLIEKRFGFGDRELVVEMMKLGDLMHARTETLSGGETRRAEMALAILRRPSCLLADEPFKSVDPLMCELLGNGYRHLASSGSAVVVTGHEVNALRPFLDSVVWVTSGTTYELGDTDSAWRHDGFRREYLGPGN
ncbi:MAG: ATP-binding cassette domain-containing protein [Gemmatimonadaceae bacterium]